MGYEGGGLFDLERGALCELMLTCAPGLEAVSAEQLCAGVPGCGVEEMLRGRLIARVAAPLKELFKLRCVDNIYLLLGAFAVGATRADLRALGESAASCDLAPLYGLLIEPYARLRAFVSASRAGKHTYSRFEAADAALRGLTEKRRFLAGERESHDLGFRLDIFEDRAYFSVKLTPATFRFRGARAFATGAIRPSIAASMVWLSAPRPGDVFLDPFCGSGTLAAEREAYPAGKILASDILWEAVEAAQRNVSDRVIVRQADARALGLADCGVTAIVTNPPWGAQVGAGDIGALYRDFLFEARRVLVDGGVIIALTDQVQALKAACEAAGMGIAEVAAVGLHGLRPSIYRITKA